MGVQPSLLDETGPLVIEAGGPFVCFELSGPPRGKQRHRYRIIQPKGFGRKAFASEYTPKETVEYEEMLAHVARIAMGDTPPTDAPVALLLHAFMPIMPSWPKRKQSDAAIGAVLPTTKPDWDNIGKMTDALKKIVWVDDAPVVDGRVIKRYSLEPALRVEVRRMVKPGPSRLDLEPLSNHAIVALKQLFINGPTGDGNIVVKGGRDELIQRGYAARVEGYAFLTTSGVALAVTSGCDREKEMRGV